MDILCGSLNRACDVKRLFQYIGLKNTQAPIKIDFVFINESSYFDPELNRVFHSSNATMFACDQEVILPHVSRQKCTCMVRCNLLNEEIIISFQNNFFFFRIVERCVQKYRRLKRTFRCQSIKAFGQIPNRNLSNSIE